MKTLFNLINLRSKTEKKIGARSLNLDSRYLLRTVTEDVLTAKSTKHKKMELKKKTKRCTHNGRLKGLTEFHVEDITKFITTSTCVKSESVDNLD